MPKISLSQFILYVSDQSASRIFYQNVLQLEPVLDVPGMSEFLLTDTCKLGLMPEGGVKSIIGDLMPQPHEGHGIPRCELYLYVEDPKSYYDRAITAGAKGISPIVERDWGDIAGYVVDADGHIIAFALKK